MFDAQSPGEHVSVVLVDDEEDILFSSSYLLESHGIAPSVTFSDPRQVIPWLEQHQVGMILLDLIMPHLPGSELLKQIVALRPEIPVVVVTASQDVEWAVSCMKQGAFDYLIKPVEESRFIATVRRALELSALRQHVGTLRQVIFSGQLRNPDCFSAILTKNRMMLTIFQYLEAVAHSTEPILITGETGVGKELIATSAHKASGRSGKMVSINVAGLDDVMFSDTLFGHVRGAYTGASTERLGLIAQARDGTLFLDEIGDLPPSTQVKLLRLIQDGQYYPLGSDVPRTSQARIIAATNKDLRQEMQKGTFRPDLFFRLSSHMVDILPLRERLEDLPLLIDHFMRKSSESLNRPPLKVAPEIYSLLSAYAFPGNVRELRALVYDAVANHSGGPVLPLDRFRAAVRAHGRSNLSHPGPLHETVRGMAGVENPLLVAPGRLPTLREATQWLVSEAMRQADGNQGNAAALLGISRQSLNRRLLTAHLDPA
ncbi:MAG: sigma-54-dependent Fis family transcriptional regulator [Magnetococcales bacterium]|nr:sigma-54-dependent Fis family transcriptional regulator [Magnetococcales bacterium]MBF0116353.1 sigma-54-dependent Fis family transcriptional regulator [Magnetococcales bacterium]